MTKTNSNEVTRSDDWYVSTFYLKPRSEKPLMHIYGPHTAAEARKLRKQFLRDMEDKRHEHSIFHVFDEPGDQDRPVGEQRDCGAVPGEKGMSGPKEVKRVVYECAGCGTEIPAESIWRDDAPEGYYMTIRRVTEHHYHVAMPEEIFVCSKECGVDVLTYQVRTYGQDTVPIGRDLREHKRKNRARGL